MKRPHLIFALFAAILVSGTTSFAQSTSRDNPMSLNSGEISGDMNDHNKETFYSFTAGPGEVTITVDVNANPDEQGLLAFDVLARNGATSLACCYGAQGNGGGTGRDVATFKLTKRQVVILHTTNGPIGGGTFRIRVSGAGLSFGSARNSGGFGEGTVRSRDRGSQGGDPVVVPANGTLHIQMKDGSTKDIDLSLIRSITLRQ